MLDRLILHCPRCGRVEGYLPAEDEEQPPGAGEQEIEEETFEGFHGPQMRVRCPKCGQWLETKREEPGE